jgi:hypothetical protein
MRQYHADRDTGAPQLLTEHRGLLDAIGRQVALLRAIGEGRRWAVGIELVGRPFVALRMAQIDDIPARPQVGDQPLLRHLLTDRQCRRGGTGQQAGRENAEDGALQDLVHAAAL